MALATMPLTHINGLYPPQVPTLKGNQQRANHLLIHYLHQIEPQRRRRVHIEIYEVPHCFGHEFCIQFEILGLEGHLELEGGDGGGVFRSSDEDALIHDSLNSMLEASSNQEKILKLKELLRDNASPGKQPQRDLPFQGKTQQRRQVAPLLPL